MRANRNQLVILSMTLSLPVSVTKGVELGFACLGPAHLLRGEIAVNIYPHAYYPLFQKKE
ncbi:hypothetical protein DFP97_113197 [Paenibacillus prosopidis]|uniref:Uncharacterized protein n=1 Tax=Paenibacillus prosopidis TaxID=630520 RepID=A0A368VVR8_9BACL|nr:hypothetical protein DFP97_113197 [Paenibacillus prosopidis]